MFELLYIHIYEKVTYTVYMYMKIVFSKTFSLNIEGMGLIY